MEMNSSSRTCSLRFFHAICLFTTIAFVAWCINEYSLDNDYTQTKFATFHQTAEDIYPSITVCIQDPYRRDKYKSYFRSLPIIGDTVDGSRESDEMILNSYKLLIGGDKSSSLETKGWLHLLNITYEKWIHGIQNIDYDGITSDFENVLTNFYIQIPIRFDHLDTLSYNASNGSLIADKVTVQKFKNSTNWKGISLDVLEELRPYVSDRGVHHKCITIDIPMIKNVGIREVGMKFDSSSFVGEQISPGKVYFYLSYPKQLLRQPLGSRIKLPFERPLDCYKFKIHLGYMRTFKRRNKKLSPCNDNWRFHDENQMSHVAEKVGCIPKHWNIPSDLPLCSRPQQFSDIAEELNDKNGYMPPCRSIETLLKTTEGKTDWRMCIVRGSFLEVKLFLDEQSHYEEVVLLPAYSLQSLVGNSGRYTNS